MSLKVFTGSFGALECDVCAPKSVVFMDLLLGDHLREKSDTVKWIVVSMPHKKNRRLKKHGVFESPTLRVTIIFED